MTERADGREELRGVLHLWSETGTEGGYWAFQDERFISKNTTRFACAKCHIYWDKSSHPDGPSADALGEARFCTPGAHDFRPVSDESWSYEGLHVLAPGDELTVYAKDGVAIVWEGVIRLKQHDLFTEHAGGMWIHADQEGIDRDTWAKWFFEGHPAKVIRAKRPDRDGKGGNRWE